MALTLLQQSPQNDAALTTTEPETVALLSQKEEPPSPWAAVFGIYEPVVISEPTVVEPTTTIVHTEYSLRGLFASATNSWAIVSGPGEEFLLRVGDELPGGGIVSNITDEGVWMDSAQGRRLITFDE